MAVVAEREAGDGGRERSAEGGRDLATRDVPENGWFFKCHSQAFRFLCNICGFILKHAIYLKLAIWDG